MKRFGSLVFLVLCLAFNAHAQERIVSPALDPDYVILKADTAFYGYYANQGLGSVLKSYPPLIDPETDGIVFIHNLDTTGFYASQLGVFDSVGLFRTGSKLFHPGRATVQIHSGYEPIVVHSQGLNSTPLIIGENELHQFQITSELSFQRKDDIRLARPNKRPTYAEDKQLFTGFFDEDTLEDLIAVGYSDSTTLLIWYGKNLHYKGDSIVLPGGTFHVIPADTQIVLPATAGEVAGDLNQDGVPDLILRTFDSDTLFVVLGKRQNGNWEIGRSRSIELPSRPLRVVHFDFLRSDGIPDVIIGTSDTIYIYDGARRNLFTSEADFEEADLKIPSPGKVDPEHFLNFGFGRIDEFGQRLFNAGNIGGHGDHSLGVLFYEWVDTAGFGDIDYCLIYSGGSAADEKADALYEERHTPYSAFTNADTVRTTRIGPSDILLADFAYTLGGTGALWHIKGRADIPHTADPRWKQVSRSPLLEIGLQLIHVDRREVTLSVPMHTTYGYLDALDMLGRTVATDRLPPYVTHYVMHLPDVPSGVYQLVYRDFHGNLLARPSKLEVLR